MLQDRPSWSISEPGRTAPRWTDKLLWLHCSSVPTQGKAIRETMPPPHTHREGHGGSKQMSSHHICLFFSPAVLIALCLSLLRATLQQHSANPA